MKSLLAIALSYLFCLSTSAQTTSSEFQAQLNADVWLPFSTALNQLDIDQYLAVHDADVLRISLDKNGVVRKGDEYTQRLQTLFRQLKEQGAHQRIEFRFTERLYADQVASEKGYYKFYFDTPVAEKKTYSSSIIYGSFHVISKKNEDGKWKIIVDFDFTSQDERHKISESDFQTGTPL